MVKENVINFDSDNRDEMLLKNIEKVWEKSSEEINDIVDSPMKGTEDLPEDTRKIVEEAFNGPLAFAD